MHKQRSRRRHDGLVNLIALALMPIAYLLIAATIALVSAALGHPTTKAATWAAVGGAVAVGLLSHRRIDRWLLAREERSNPR